MAWKRGTQNNTPIEFRFGHVKEFREAHQLQHTAHSLSTRLRIVEAKTIPSLLQLTKNSSHVYASPSSCSCYTILLHDALMGHCFLLFSLKRYVSTLQNGLDADFHVKCTHLAQKLTGDTGLSGSGTSGLMYLFGRP
jgi:hypothetical protein